MLEAVSVGTTTYLLCISVRIAETRGFMNTEEGLVLNDPFKFGNPLTIKQVFVIVLENLVKLQHNNL